MDSFDRGFRIRIRIRFCDRLRLPRNAFARMLFGRKSSKNVIGRLLKDRDKTGG